MVTRVEPPQRQLFYRLHLGGEAYEQIAERFGVSRECVRYWCRRQREGGTPTPSTGIVRQVCWILSCPSCVTSFCVCA